MKGDVGKASLRNKTLLVQWYHMQPYPKLYTFNISMGHVSRGLHLLPLHSSNALFQTYLLTCHSYIDPLSFHKVIFILE